MTNAGLRAPIGIIDIGSNSIRLCVYDRNQRVPVPLFNEKAVCALGLGLGASGRLNPAGAAEALAVIGRFVALARAMGLESLDILATAAVRDAADGADFVRAVETGLGVEVTVLGGGDEARLAALGVLCGTPDANGIVADLGGGSLELITVGGGDVGDHVTMPLGVLRLGEAAGEDRLKAADIVDAHLSSIPWLKGVGGGTLYAVGGAWRAIARICIAQTQHPLTVLDNFAIDAREARAIVELVATQSRKSLEKVMGVSKKRVGSLPLAALVLDKVLTAVRPERLVFSIYGLREGRFFERLPSVLRNQDPLLSVCRQMSMLNSRFAPHADEVMAWMAPLFADEGERDSRLRQAACLVSDVFWGEHPDYRAEQAFLRMLRLPFMGVPHHERAAIALTIHYRYQGDEAAPLAQGAMSLLTEAAIRRCRITGLALRLAHTLSGGAPGLLSRTRLGIEGGNLVVEFPEGDGAFSVEPDRTFDRLAGALGCEMLVCRVMCA